MPLRRPSTSPGGTAQSLRPPATNTANGEEQLLMTRVDTPKMESHLDLACQGRFRCVRCKKTSYCSELCQKEDWNAHRHLCKVVIQGPAKQLKKFRVSRAAMTHFYRSVIESILTFSMLVNHSDVSSLKRVYLRDLKINTIPEGTEIQAMVVDIQSPGRFFLLAQDPELLEAIHVISVELQKTYSGYPSATAYLPSLGEVCAVQFSSDMNWYRGLVQSVAADQKTANILYIDFGNEEDAPMDRIKPLAANIPPSPPCVMECQIAGVVPTTGTWMGECCIAVRQLVASKTVTVSVVAALESGRIHAVDISLSSVGKQLSTFLIEHGYAVKEDGKCDVKRNAQEINALVSASLENFNRQSVGKDSNAWAQPPEPLTQCLGDSYSVIVTFIQSPLDIICQKVGNAGAIQELQVKLRDHCSQVPADPNFRPAPGTVCCAQFSEDNQWYRTKVMAYSSEERICVGYIDFGNSEEVDLNRLRPLSALLLALPMQAIPCGLAGVQPIGETWSSDCMVALQRTVSNRILRVEIMGVHEGKALVAMIDEASDPQANVAELLISAGYATPANNSVQQTEQAAAAAEEPNVSSVACEPLVWTCAELPCDGQMVALVASIVVNPGEFYCRIYNPKDKQVLAELEADLKRHCEADAPPFKPKVGEPCCTVCPGDGAWYRAMVKGLEGDKAEVLFVDYGYSVEVELSYLRAITPRLLTLPFQAFRCWLTGVEPLGSKWSSEALLWFQTLMDGQQLSARVLSVTERGYGVELESMQLESGQSVAAALISEKLAKVPGTKPPPAATPTETHASTSSPAKNPERIERENTQVRVQASNNPAPSSKEAVVGRPTPATPSAAASFPVDWKTVELPHNENFEPCIAAITSPSLFYILSPNQADLEKLRGVTMELAVYCNANQALFSSSCPVQARPAPGAACCAQFSDDDNWYRAVVLEASDNEVTVLYADYGNCEKMTYSRILPIPLQLLQHPFRIVRCALTGKEHFPTVWPVELLEMFSSLLSDGVLATTQSFDGSTNLLSVTKRDGGQLSAMILDWLQAQAKSLSGPASPLKAEHADNSTSSAAAAPDCPQPKSVTETHEGQECTSTTTGPATAPGPTQTQMNHVPAVNASGPHTCDCCVPGLSAKFKVQQEIFNLLEKGAA
ncbi:tudor domain-containing protein 1 [Diretmus argenteus]